MSAESKVVVITGASSGIGKELALGLAKRAPQYKLVLAARRAEELQAVAAACGGDDVAIAVPTDVTKREDVQRLLKAGADAFGRIDVVVNNAGKGCMRLASALDDELIDEMITVNVKSSLYGMQEALPYFAKNADGRGQVVNVSSVLGRHPMPLPGAEHRSAYTASKHFLNAITEVFRAEMKLKNPNVIVSLYSPGVVATDFGLSAGGGDSRAIPGAQDPTEVAQVLIDEVIVKGREDVYSKDIYQGAVEAYIKSKHSA